MFSSARAFRLLLVGQLSGRKVLIVYTKNSSTELSSFCSSEHFVCVSYERKEGERK